MPAPADTPIAYLYQSNNLHYYTAYNCDPNDPLWGILSSPNYPLPLGCGGGVDPDPTVNKTSSFGVLPDQLPNQAVNFSGVNAKMDPNAAHKLTWENGVTLQEVYPWVQFQPKGMDEADTAKFKAVFDNVFFTLRYLTFTGTYKFKEKDLQYALNQHFGDNGSDKKPTSFQVIEVVKWEHADNLHALFCDKVSTSVLVVT